MRQALDNAEYSSVADFVAASEMKCANPKNYPLYKRIRDGSIVNDLDQWFGEGIASGDHVRKLMHDGWPDGMAKLQAMQAKIAAVESAPQDRRRRLTRSDFGDSLDMDAVYAGRLDSAWQTSRRQFMTATQHVTIVMNLQILGSEDASILFWRGAAMVALADQLERAGYQAQLVCANKAPALPQSAGKPTIHVRVTIKDHDKPLDIATVSTALLPGFSRCVKLSWVANHCPLQLTDGVASCREYEPRDGEIYCGNDVYDEATAIAWVNAQIAKLDGREAA